MTDDKPKSLVARLREASTGYDEWRVQDPKDGSYCIAYSWPEHFSPERQAREWLADHKARFPGGRYANYEVAKVRVKTQADSLLEEAADEIERLRSEFGAFADRFMAGERERCERRIEVLTAHLRETEARYMALLKAVADNTLLLPRPMFVVAADKSPDEAIDKARTR